MVFLNDEIQSYVLFDIIQKLKHEHTFLKKYTNWENWEFSHLNERREKAGISHQSVFYNVTYAFDLEDWKSLQWS